MGTWIKRLWSCENFLKKEEKLGPLPTNREAYLRVLSIAWPAVLESLLISMISVADTAMVSSMGTKAVAAVGISGMPRSIALSVIFSLNVGVSAVVSRRKGEGNQEGANRCLKQCVIITIVLSLLLSAISIIYAEPILRFTGAQEEYIDQAVLYSRIIMASLVFTALSQTITAAQRGCGNTRISMWTNVAANVVNVVLNYLLIGGHLGFPRLGIMGAAIASVSGFIVSALIAVLSALRKGKFLYLASRGSWWFDKETMKSIWKVSSSTILEQVVFSRIGYFIHSKMLATLGTMEYATHQICSNLSSISLSFTDGFCVTASTLMGQSLGEKRADKSRLYVGVCQRVAFMGAFILSCIYIFMGKQLMMIYSKETAVIELGILALIICGLMTNIQTSQNIYTAALRGAGDTKYVAYISMISIMILRPGLCWILAYGLKWGLVGAWIASWSDQFVRFVLSYGRFRTGRWKNIKV